MSEPRSSRRIHLLREDVSRRIAAGEVIDRPLSVVRELIDNAIDASATEIDVAITDGGISEIRVRDNGIGMNREDLILSVEPHATSKITELDDLFTATSLGFRGEALPSIAASARLEMVSATREEAPRGHRILFHGGKLVSESPTSAQPGTIATVKDLFYATPARKRFLARPSTEAARCRSTFLEKALPFPHVGFTLEIDGKRSVTLSRSDDHLERVASAFSGTLDTSMLYRGSHTVSPGDSSRACPLSIEVVATDPSYSRGDRRLIQIYVNQRRIDEFALVQAVQYAYEPILPGGRFPAAFVFIQVDPAEVDFNIHPAKREVRFRTIKEIHHHTLEAVRAAIRAFGGYTVTSPVDGTHSLDTHRAPYPKSAEAPSTPMRSSRTPRISEPELPFGSISPLTTTRHHAARFDLDRVRVTGDDPSNINPPQHPRQSESPFVFHGQLFSLFLLVEQGNTLFLIDQHAAHERILFDRFSTEPGDVQQLLVPRRIELPENIEDADLKLLFSALADLGITFERLELEDATPSWYLTALPEGYRGMEQTICEFVTECRGSLENLKRRLFATMACRSAVKDSDRLDAVTAVELAAHALQLPEPRCPHGRPIWHAISRDELFSLVGRT